MTTEQIKNQLKIGKAFKDFLWVLAHPREAMQLDRERFVAKEHYDSTVWNEKSLREISDEIKKRNT